MRLPNPHGVIPGTSDIMVLFGHMKYRPDSVGVSSMHLYSQFLGYVDNVHRVVFQPQHHPARPNVNPHGSEALPATVQHHHVRARAVCRPQPHRHIVAARSPQLRHRVPSNVCHVGLMTSEGCHTPSGPYMPHIAHSVPGAGGELVTVSGGGNAVDGCVVSVRDCVAEMPSQKVPHPDAMVPGDGHAQMSNYDEIRHSGCVTGHDMLTGVTEVQLFRVFGHVPGPNRGIIRPSQ
mmetsp:Transcript_27314/g.63009  ORF Transcript_27314/g.63009 Transcript_27314/m.63009 type:complete len:234 (-) Transcript_27314:1115-1816(-)